MIETPALTMMCVICSQVVKTAKGDNADQHFCRHTSHAYAKLKGEPRKICVKNWKKSVRRQTSCMSTFTKSDNNRCEASYRLAYHLGVAGKPYSDGELVKRCLINLVEGIYRGEETDYSLIAFSRYTIQCRQNDIAKQLNLSLQTKIHKEASLFSLIVDESTDIKDSAQLLVFIRSLSPRFDLCEDLLSMEALSSRTRGEDIFVPVKNICLRNGLDLKNLRGIRKDGAPAMTGNLQGFVARFSEYVSEEYNNKQLISLHCFIHQEALCVKSVALNATLKEVNRIILYIRSNALHHRQFRELLELSERPAKNNLYHTAVRWLSHGETSRRVP